MKKVIVVGGGPAGLMAAEVLSQAGVAVDVYDAMPSAGRKFLLAGKGGLNLTHSEPAEIFASRFGARRAAVEPWLQDFGATQARDWAKALGVDTFVGTSGRVFPSDMKAAPLLRAWLHRLRHGGLAGQAGVKFHMRHRWVGWGDGNADVKVGNGNVNGSDSDSDSGNGNGNASGNGKGRALVFDTPLGRVQARADAVVLALGGGSWSRLGSDGAWVPVLAARGVDVSPLLPSNCGFDVAGGWSEHFATRFAGQPFKSVAIRFKSVGNDSNQASANANENENENENSRVNASVNVQGQSFTRKGEFVATATGVEGSLIYAASSLLRDEIAATGRATFHLDLRPDLSAEKVLEEVSHPRGSRSLSSHLKSRLGIEGIKAAILHELLTKAQMNDPAQLARAVKAVPVTLVAARPLDEAISSAGGVEFDGLDANLMLKKMRGVFCAGEMLDWEAPTGGYLLTACLASGNRAGAGAARFVGVK